MSDFSGVAAQSQLNQSQAFAAALQRAKQIAAKIQPNQGPQQGGGGGGGGGGAGLGIGGGSGGGGGFKRSHDDSDSGPDCKRFTSPGSDYGQNNSNMSSGSGGGGSSGGPANMSQALAQAAAVAARLAAAAGTTCEEQVRIPDCIAQQVLGRGSNDTITHIQAESGCKVQLSQDAAERMVTLRGSRESVTKGREMLQQLANRNGGENVEVLLTINMPPPGPTGYPPYQEIMIPGQKVGLVIGKGGDTIKQLQEKTGAKMVIIQDGPNQEVIKPLRISGDPQKIEHAKQLVFELIAQKDAQAAQQGARNTNMNSNNGGFSNQFGGANGGPPPGGEKCEVFVPKIAVGVVIGKGGDMIRKIQAECGCKLQFIQGNNDEPGDRTCIIQGTRQQVDDAKRTIEGLIENVMTRNQTNRNPNSNGNGGGDNGNSNYGYGYGVNHAQQPGREEITFMVPASKCGIVIGRGGETIKLINQQSGAYCEMDRNATNPPTEKLFKCKGSSEQVEAARQMIAEKINMEINILSRKAISGGPPMPQQQQVAPGYPQMQGDPNAAYQQQWANYAQQAATGWGDQSQQQQHPMGMAQAAGAPGGAAAAGQADYSQQWIEYYRSMGMHREAEMIEQQLKAKQAAAGAANAGMQQQAHQQQQQQQAAAQAASASDAQQQADYSAQWAEYYRSIGKIEEAEEIEKQMKAKQSSSGMNVGAGNSNPNAGGAAAGHQAAAAAAAAAASQGYPQGMTASQYAQYSQYYAAAAAAGQQQQPGAPGGMGGGYPPQQPYGGYGGYPGAPQPPGSNNAMGGPPQKSNKPDKN